MYGLVKLTDIFTALLVILWLVFETSQFINISTVQRKFLTGENIDEFDESPAIRQYFPYQNFPFS